MKSTLSSLICSSMIGLGIAGVMVLPNRPAAARTVPAGYQTQRIEFAPGATSTVVYHNKNYYPVRYVLRANANQLMTIEADSSQSRVYLTMTGADGTRLIVAPQELTSWRGRLPKTQDYYIEALKPAGVDYNLRIAIAPNTPQITGQRIQFAPGATSEVISGTLLPHTSRFYLANARAFQLMSVNVNSPGANTSWLTLYGVDGTLLENGSKLHTQSWYGRLPKTEDYHIQVDNPKPYPINYTLTVGIQ
ncbi:serine/threonine protein kinase [Nostoc sp. NIES-4103]|nr:serine/threonine protein kinase [Nostoc sp. NIES-4103]